MVDSYWTVYAVYAAAYWACTALTIVPFIDPHVLTAGHVEPLLYCMQCRLPKTWAKVWQSTSYLVVFFFNTHTPAGCRL